MYINISYWSLIYYFSAIHAQLIPNVNFRKQEHSDLRDVDSVFMERLFFISRFWDLYD